MKVFLAHSSFDKNFVRAVKRDLNSFGFETWLDEDDILAGDSIISSIGLGIRESNYLCVVLSAQSVKSEWMNRELNSALTREIGERKTLVIPLLLEACERPTFLLDKKYANFSSSYEEGFDELLKALHFESDTVHPDQDLVLQRLALTRQASEFLRTGVTDLAETYIQRALSMAREDASLWRLLGRCLLNQGLPANALVAYQRANRLSPHSRWILYDYGTCALHYALYGQDDPLGLYPDPELGLETATRIAEGAFKEILDIREEDALAHYQLGCLYAFRRNLEQARAHTKRAVEIYPNYQLAKDLLNQLNAATT